MSKIVRTAAIAISVAGLTFSSLSSAAAQPVDAPDVPPISVQIEDIEIGTMDADVSNGWTRMYLSGYPSGWNASARSTVPGGNCAHFQFTGPNGLNWSSPQRCNPAQASVSGTGAGQVCVTQWVRQPNGSYLANGRPCANVY